MGAGFPVPAGETETVTARSNRRSHSCGRSPVSVPDLYARTSGNAKFLQSIEAARKTVFYVELTDNGSMISLCRCANSLINAASSTGRCNTFKLLIGQRLPVENRKVWL
jgi:hypothetical protein